MSKHLTSWLKDEYKHNPEWVKGFAEAVYWLYTDELANKYGYMLVDDKGCFYNAEDADPARAHVMSPDVVADAAFIRARGIVETTTFYSDGTNKTETENLWDLDED